MRLGGLGAERTFRPYFIDICPAARLMRSLGTKRGETFLGPWGRLTLVDGGPWVGRRTPLSRAMDVSYCTSKLPMPEPMQIPCVDHKLDDGSAV